MTMPRLRWPHLSIRATVLIAIVVGVVLPALVVLAVDDLYTRRAQDPVLQRNRAAVMVLAAAVITEPAWTLSEPGLNAAVTRILDEPSVCSVEVFDLQPTVAPLTRRRASCEDTPTALREAAVLHEGQQIARLRLGFDPREIDRAIAERRGVTAWLVAAQVLLGVAVLAGVLSLRLLRPIDALKRQAGRLAAREGAPPQPWPRRDELGQLGQHLNTVHGQIAGLIGELEAKNAELRRMAMHDALTGLPNRTLLRELFVHEAAKARRDGKAMALMFLDLDAFKAINDTHGHAAGDALLVAVGHAMRDALRESDVVCRLGGDEFLVLLPQVQGAEQVVATAERLLRTVEAPRPLTRSGTPVRVRGSLGIARYPEDGDDFDALVQAADLAMYRSKQLGRARHGFYHPGLDGEARRRAALGRDLGAAVDARAFVLHHLPLVDARSGELRASEALLRWPHAERGLLGPAEFLPLAEERGHAVAIGRWVLASACTQFAAWKAEGQAPAQLVVNLGLAELREPALAAFIAETLRRHGLAPDELLLDVPEAALHEALTRDALAGLHAAGLQLAIDDFGSSSAAIGLLRGWKPVQLKIDRGLVQGLPEVAGDRAVVQAILAVGRTLDIAVVAEGVETEAQRDWLLAQGCVLQQGFLWGRPAPLWQGRGATRAA